MSGVVEGSLGLGEMDLDEDWDPAKYEVLHRTGKYSPLLYLLLQDDRKCVAWLKSELNVKMKSLVTGDDAISIR